jgi:hypothetical protein
MKNLIYICFGFILFMIGCEDKNNFNNNLLIDATFKNNWTNPDYKTFLLIQNLDGEVIADTGFTGNANFNLILKDSETAPERMIVTTVNQTSDGYISVTSNAGIRSGVEWVWDGLENDDRLMFTSNINFSNMGDFEKGVLSSNGQYQRLSGFDYECTFEHYGEENSPEDILFMAYKNDGTGYYQIFDNASIINNSFIIDGNNLNLANYKLISNNTGEKADNVMLYAYDNQESFASKNRHRLGYYGYQEEDFDDDENFHSYYPPNYSNFVTNLASGSLGSQGQKSWSQKTFGEIPNSLEKINADFQLVDSSAAGFQINTTGVYDNIAFKFRSLMTTSTIAWDFYLNPDVQDIISSLPMLNSDVIEYYTEFSNSEFSLSLDRVSIADFLCANNNDEWTDILFSDGYYGDICNGYRYVEYYVE